MLCCALVLMKSPSSEVSGVYKSSQEAITEPLSPTTSAPISCLKSGRVRPGLFIYESLGSKAVDEQKPGGTVQPGGHRQAVCLSGSAYCVHAWLPLVTQYVRVYRFYGF